MKKIFSIIFIILICLCLLQSDTFAMEKDLITGDIAQAPVPGGHPGPPPVLNEKQKSEVLSFIQKYMPSNYETLGEIKEVDPGRYNQILLENYRIMTDLRELANIDGEAYKDSLKAIKLEDESIKLARKYRKAREEEEKGQISKKLKSILSELFDLREKERARRIKQLEQELARLKESLNNRKKNKDTIVQQRMDELTGKKENLQW
ncbi:MAG: hypothetical protein ABRQ39_02775 [Candidatus Eremiobacterota bacterium]